MNSSRMPFITGPVLIKASGRMMMKRILPLLCASALVLLGAGCTDPASRGNAMDIHSLDNWFSPVKPRIEETILHDGTRGPAIYLPVGTPAYTFLAANEGGEGSVTMWVHDPGKNLTRDIGDSLGRRGPMWGLVNPSGGAVLMGIYRAVHTSGSQGYSPWCNLAPTSPWWFYNGVRGSVGQEFKPGWYKWTVTGTMEDISFTLHDAYTWGEFVAGHAGPQKWSRGDATGTITKNWEWGSFAAALGQGWNGVQVVGDDVAGIEDIHVDITGGTGVFKGIAGTKEK